MRTLPSKELLSQVLGVEILDCKVVGNGVAYNAKDNYPTQSINIYELAHKCKEWAFEKDCVLTSSVYNKYAVCLVNEGYINESQIGCDFEARQDTEPEAVFKACEYILKEMR